MYALNTLWYKAVIYQLVFFFCILKGHSRDGLLTFCGIWDLHKAENSLWELMLVLIESLAKGIF